VTNYPESFAPPDEREGSFAETTPIARVPDQHVHLLRGSRLRSPWTWSAEPPRFVNSWRRVSDLSHPRHLTSSMRRGDAQSNVPTAPRGRNAKSLKHPRMKLRATIPRSGSPHRGHANDRGPRPCELQARSRGGAGPGPDLVSGTLSRLPLPAERIGSPKVCQLPEPCRLRGLSGHEREQARRRHWFAPHERQRVDGRNADIGPANPRTPALAATIPATWLTGQFVPAEGPPRELLDPTWARCDRVSTSR